MSKKLVIVVLVLFMAFLTVKAALGETTYKQASNVYYHLLPNISNLEIYIPFDADISSTDTLYDHTLNYFNYSTVGGYSFSTDAVSGLSLALDGSVQGHFKSVTDKSAPQTGFTMMSWFKINDAGVSTLWSMNGSFQARYEDTNRIICRIYNDTGNSFSTSNTLFTIGTGGWNHVACVYNVTHIAIYINGTLMSNTSTPSLINDTPSRWHIGSYVDANYLNGSIDDFAYFNTPLTASQIQAIYDSKTIPTYQNATFYVNYTATTHNKTNVTENIAFYNSTVQICYQHHNDTASRRYCNSNSTDINLTNYLTSSNYTITLNQTTPYSALIFYNLTQSVYTNPFAGIVYISSSAGNDLNDGYTEGSPIATITQLNSLTLDDGTIRAFKRGDTWHCIDDEYITFSDGNATHTNVWTAYGTGNKPIFYGSLSANDASKWVNFAGNVWWYNETISYDIGAAWFNNQNYTGAKRNFTADLRDQGDFYYNTSDDHVYMYSTAIPTTSYTDIQLALEKIVMEFNNMDYIKIGNMSVMYGGEHGFAGYQTTNVELDGVEVHYIGGAYLYSYSLQRYGNGIQFGLRTKNTTVRDSLVSNVMDDAFTHQGYGSPSGDGNLSNIRYINCTATESSCGFTFFGSSKWNFSNLLVQDSQILRMGHGWSRDLRLTTLNYSSGLCLGTFANPVYNSTFRNILIDSQNSTETRAQGIGAGTNTQITLMDNITIRNVFKGLKVDDNCSLNMTNVSVNSNTFVLRTNSEAAAPSSYYFSNLFLDHNQSQPFFNVTKLGFSLTINQTWNTIYKRIFMYDGSWIGRNLNDIYLTDDNFSDDSLVYLYTPNVLKIDGTTNLTKLYRDSTLIGNSTEFQVNRTNATEYHIRNLQAATVNATVNFTLDNVTITCTNLSNITYTSDTGAYSYLFMNGTNISCLNGYVTINVTGIEYATGSNKLVIGTLAGAGVDLTAPVITAVLNSSITDSSVTISWTTDDSSNSTVQYGLTAALGSIEKSSSLTTSHSLGLSGLAALTLYYYNVSSCNSDGYCNRSIQYNFTTINVTVEEPNPSGLCWAAGIAGASAFGIIFKFAVVIVIASIIGIVVLSMQGGSIDTGGITDSVIMIAGMMLFIVIGIVMLIMIGVGISGICS